MKGKKLMSFLKVVIVALPLFIGGCSITPAEWQQLSQQLQQTSASFESSSQQRLQQSQQYSAPQVQPISPYGSSGSTTYRQIGNTVIGSDGSRCQIVGQTTICN